MKPSLNLFETVAELETAVVELLRREAGAGSETGVPAGLLLPGGGTPQGVYRALTAAPLKADVSCHILLSDDRLEPDDQPRSNYYHLQPMLEAAHLPQERVHRIDKSLPLDEAAGLYEADLAHYLAEGGHLTLGLLGLGTDGHTAALFRPEHLKAAERRLAIGLERPDHMLGVTVTPAFLAQVERLIFLVNGESKQNAVRALLETPETITAGLATRDHPRVEVWLDRAAEPD